ncbi:MAG: hypothetical protein HY661_10355 [Betaproteobacteria bacterium]|nr:hypothetical protein [Betaproteobacteria bacterium]
MRLSAPVLPADPLRAGSLCDSGAGIAAVRLPTMVLDRSGTVRCCDDQAANLFGARPESLVGKHINALIPGLPLNVRTPGYNLAYATFWALGGPPRLHCGVDSCGGSFDLRIALEKLELNKKQWILLSLHRPVERHQSSSRSAEFHGCSRAGEVDVYAKGPKSARKTPA